MLTHGNLHVYSSSSCNHLQPSSIFSCLGSNRRYSAPYTSDLSPVDVYTDLLLLATVITLFLVLRRSILDNRSVSFYFTSANIIKIPGSSQTTPQSLVRIQDLQSFWNEQFKISWVFIFLFTRLFTKSWFPYDRCPRSVWLLKRLKFRDRSDYMETTLHRS